MMCATHNSHFLACFEPGLGLVLLIRCSPSTAVSPGNEIEIFQNTILQANIRSHSAKKICGDAVYIDKVEKSITRPVLEVEKSFLGQNGVEFQVKMIENIKRGKTMKLRTLCASYLFSSWNLKNLIFSLQNVSKGSRMILAQMAHNIYMSNLTLKSTQKLLLNFISTIDNNETAVFCRHPY